jgi:cysteine desulfurase
VIYLDHAATTPLVPEAREAMERAWADAPGNPASAHAAGRAARKILEDSRERIAGLLNADPSEVIFTSGATEANNLALFGLAGDPPGQILAGPMEHPCVVEPLGRLKMRGSTVDYLPVSSEGGVCAPQSVAQVRLVSLQFVNHETGAIQPVEALRAPQVAVHTDAAQAVGKIVVDFHRLGVAALTVSAHKFGGPPGIGALLLRRGVHLQPMFFGGHQQQSRRPGTEPAALAAGMAAALEIAVRDLDRNRAHVADLRRRFLEGLQQAGPHIVNGPTDGVPHILNVSFPGCAAERLLIALDLAGVACSTGSACSSGSLLPSPVLQAMGVPDEVLRSAMRFSFAPAHSSDEIARAAEIVAETVRRMRGLGFRVSGIGIEMEN